MRRPFGSISTPVPYDRWDVECPDPETLELLFSGELAPDRRAVIADHAANCPDCHELIDVLFEPTTASLPFAPGLGFGLGAGARIDRYVIERRIGQGGMGVVYAARDPELGRGIAIKVLRVGAPAERLRREAQALARLSHPNVVAVHDVGEHAGQTFIAMALVDGDNLRRWLEQPRSVAETLGVLRAAGRGIAAAHAAGLIHRDLKPDNIFIAHDGAVLVGDFGLARDVEPAAAVEHAALDTPIEMTATGTVLGTPAYMAPEQADGAATAASDQFAFCITAWEALYGARPFRAKTLPTLQAEIAAGAIALPSDQRGVPSRIHGALQRGLAARPDARFGSMDQLLDVLAPRRRRWPWLVGGTGALATIAIITTLELRHREAPLACDTEHLLDAAWGPSQHAALPPVDAAALDVYATRWLAIRHELCVTHSELGPALAEARVGCLDQRRAALGLVIGALATKHDPMTALQVIDRLPSLEDCTRAVVVVKTPEQRAAVDALELRINELDTDYFYARKHSLDDVRVVIREAERAGAERVAVSAIGLEGMMLRDAGLTEQAEASLRRALVLAERTGDDLGRIRISTQLIDVLVRLQRIADAHNMLDQTSAVLARVGNVRNLELELVVARVGILTAETDHRGAAELLRGYVASREQDGNTIQVLLGYLMLGRELAASEQTAEAAAAYRKFADVERKAGIEDGDATQALDAEASAAQTAGQFTRAIELHERVLAIVRSKQQDATLEAHALYMLATSYYMAADWVKLRETSQSQLALIPDNELTRPDRAIALENIGVGYLYSNDAAHAIDPLRKAIALGRELGAANADAVVTASIALGLALVEVGKLGDARALLEPLLPTLSKAEPSRPWRRGTVSFTLARALWDDGNEHDRGRARALAADAERDFVDSIDTLSKLPTAAGSVRLIQQRLAALRTWRQRHQ
jgi:tetratricopeptide (TPR) repeat protein/predicted Ser/Thr protein kinase